MQRRGYKGTSTLLFQAQIPCQSTSAIEGTDYLEVQIVLFISKVLLLMLLMLQFKLHEFSVAQSGQNGPPGQDLGGHRFESCRGLRFFVRPTLVRCLSSHFHISFTELKIYHLSFFQSCNVFSSIKFVQCSLITFVSKF